MVPDLKGGHMLADFFHNAGKLMAQNHRGSYIRRAFVPIVDVDICAADAAGGDPDDNLVIPGFP